MIVEMHCHTSEHSKCSHVPAVHLVRRSLQVGIQSMILTDHHYQWSFEEIRALRKEADVPATFGLLSGQEVDSADYGHLLVYGAAETIENRLKLREIRRLYPEAAIVWAHPYRDGKAPSRERLLSDLIDAVEIFNSNYSVTEAARALKDWHRYRFTAIGGTDTHGHHYVGMYPTIFDHPFKTISEMIVELKAGRCRPYFKEMASAGTSHTEVTELTVGPRATHQRKTIIIKTFDSPEAWQGGEKGHAIAEALYRHGFDRGACRVARPLEKDKRTLSLVEEKVCGKTLYEAVVSGEPEQMKHFMKMAACWLCKLHNSRFHITPADEYLQIEPERLDYYLTSLIENNHRFLDRVRQIRNRVLECERELIGSRPELLMQGHGDYHAKNIYVCDDPHTQEKYIAAIDLGSSHMLPAAFDVGTFLAQYVNMFFNQMPVQLNAPADIFLHAYMENAEALDDDFLHQVALFKARTCLSILYYLVKVGMGSSPNFWRVMVEAERDLASVESRLLHHAPAGVPQ